MAGSKPYHRLYLTDDELAFAIRMTGWIINQLRMLIPETAHQQRMREGSIRFLAKLKARLRKIKRKYKRRGQSIPM